MRMRFDWKKGLWKRYSHMSIKTPTYTYYTFEKEYWIEKLNTWIPGIYLEFIKSI